MQDTVQPSKISCTVSLFGLTNIEKDTGKYIVTFPDVLSII